MARITDCKYENEKLGIDEALKLRDKMGERAFRCLSCGQPLVAHRGGSDGESHFEHERGSSPCQAITMKLCDDLEAQLKAKERTASKLVEAVVTELVA